MSLWLLEESLWPLGRGRKLQSTMDDDCSYTTWMKAMYWTFAGVWAQFFLVWAALVFSPGKRRRGLRLFLFLLPLVMFGNAIVQVHLYTTCPCLLCPYMNWEARRAISASVYAFHIGRLVVFPLCLYVIATGCGTIYSRMPMRGWLVVLLVFGGFAASLGCIIPSSDPSLDINLAAARVAAVLMYVAVYLIVLLEAVLSCKVLKAQLLMIRQQRIDPRSCPAWAKFRLFNWLRRFVCAYLTVEAVFIVLQMLPLPWVWKPITTMVWELMQVCIAGAIGWVFGGTTFNHFVESERHMLPSEVPTSSLLAPSDMTLEWQDDDDGVLAAWQATSPVPPPPQTPPLFSALGGHRTANQAALNRARANRGMARAAPVESGAS